MQTKAPLSVALLLACANLACDAPDPLDEDASTHRAAENADGPGSGLTAEHELEYDFEQSGHVLAEDVDLSGLIEQETVTLMLQTPFEPTPFQVYDADGELVGESEIYAEFVEESEEDDGGLHYFTRIEIDPTVLQQVTVTAEVSSIVHRGYLLLCDELVTNRAPAGTGSLRRAVDQVRDGGSVCFDPVEFSDTSAGPVVLTGEITAAKDLSIWAPSPAVARITTQGTARVFAFEGDVALRRLHLLDGRATEGGLVRSSGALTIRDSLLESGEADRGGAVFVAETGSLVLENTGIGESRAHDDGGGVYAAGPATIADSFIAHNEAGNAGGGLYLGGNSTLDDTGVHHNTARDNGGGLFAGSALRLQNETFVFSNEAYRGGGIHYSARDETLTLEGSSVHSNVVFDNLPDGEGLQRARGGGIHLSGGNLDIVSDPQGVGLPPAVAYNRAVWGGGIYVWWYSTVTVRGDASVFGNHARLGGGILNTDTLQLREHATVEANTATEDGGGLWNAHVLEVFDNVRIQDNVADRFGGGAYNDGDLFLLFPTIRVVGNAASQGGGIYNDDLLSYLQGTQQVSSNAPDDVYPPPP